MRPRPKFAVVCLVVLALTPALQATTTVTLEQERVRMWIPAVGQHENGTLFGIASDLEVVLQRPGSGRVYVSTQPLTQVDMQGSARLAVDAASHITGISADSVDFFFSVKTPAVTIGGPSAGGAMAVAVTALLQGWSVRDDVVMTGMINPDGSIGPIGGVLQKLEAADSVGASMFLVPLGQSVVLDAQDNEVDAKEVGRDRYGIRVEEVADLYDAIGPFTGNRLVRPTPSTDPLKDAAYTDITNRLSENLTARSQARRADLHERASRIEVSSATDREIIEQQLRSGDAQLATAVESQNRSKHYLAASQAFQSLVSYGYAEAMIAFFESEEDRVEVYAQAYMQTTDAFLATVERETAVEYPIRAAQLDSLGASEDRFIEAKALEAEAARSAEDQEFGETLRLSSFARERAESARWWAEIGREIAENSNEVPVTEQSLRALLAKYTDAATLELEYAALIAAGQPNYVAATQAFAVSEIAREQGRLAASLTNLIETFARTSTALVQLSGAEAVRARLPAMADAAAYEIEVARSQQIPPIYAVSVLELGQSQIENDPVGAYASMLQARIAARTSVQAAQVQSPVPGVEPYRGGFGLPSQAPAWIALGVVFALIAIVLVIVVVRAESRRRTPAPALPASDVPAPAPPTPAPTLPPPIAPVPNAEPAAPPPAAAPAANPEAEPTPSSQSRPRTRARGTTPRREPARRARAPVRGRKPPDA